MKTERTNVYQSAADMIRNHGELAFERSNTMADNYLASGDVEQSLAWTRIKLAIRELTNNKNGQKRH
ncbi:MAG: hypothetical protein JKY60_01765 [Kordiimonadaceae bacterium]|nr:hypothetical protein [Kordiimonadaceae bacterium]